jgi:hypothetical protein
MVQDSHYFVIGGYSPVKDHFNVNAATSRNCLLYYIAGGLWQAKRLISL